MNRRSVACWLITNICAVVNLIVYVEQRPGFVSGGKLEVSAKIFKMAAFCEHQ